jgi:hypothetical protein
MVSTRSQTRAAAKVAANSNKKIRKAQIFVIPAEKLENARVHVINTKKVQQQPQPKKETTTPTPTPTASRIMTRSMTRCALKNAMVESWNTYTEEQLELLKRNKSADGVTYTWEDRKSIWINFIKYMLNECEKQVGDLENKAICATNIYKILSYMFQCHFMDFASKNNSYKNFWDTTFAKERELLADLEKHIKKGKITKQTYTECKKYVQSAQTYQMMYDTLVFPERAGFAMKTPTLF